MKDGDNFTPEELGLTSVGEYRLKVLFTGTGSQGAFFEFSLNPNDMRSNHAFTALDHRFQTQQNEWVTRCACLHWNESTNKWIFRGVRPLNNNVSDPAIVLREIQVKVYA